MPIVQGIAVVAEGKRRWVVTPWVPPGTSPSACSKPASPPSSRCWPPAAASTSIPH